VDEAFLSFADWIRQMTAFEGAVGRGDAGLETRITAVEIETPLELSVSRDASGNLVIGTTPPLYPLMTTIGPVFHRARFRASLTGAGDG
jgi:hypothetical protein